MKTSTAPSSVAPKTRPLRDGRSSAKRLAAAKADALRARHRAGCRAEGNAHAIARLIEHAGLTDDYQTIQWHRLGLPIGTGRISGFIADFLGVKETDLTNDSLVRKHFTTLWNHRFEGKTHEKCKKQALADLRVPSWSHLTGTDTCPCCGLKLGCEHTKFRSIPSAECHTRGIYHGGRCYHVSECLDCGIVSAVDSSD